VGGDLGKSGPVLAWSGYRNSVSRRAIASYVISALTTNGRICSISADEAI